MRSLGKPDLEQLLLQEGIYRIKKKPNPEPFPSQSRSRTSGSHILPNKDSSFSNPPIKSVLSPLQEPNFSFEFEKAEKSDSKSKSNLMNLISRGKNKGNNEEIDLFEEESGGAAAENVFKTNEFENYWKFLANNIGNKNIMVIPVDDEEPRGEDVGFWRFPLKDIIRWNKPQNLRNSVLYRRKQIKEEPKPFTAAIETPIADRMKWLNTFEMAQNIPPAQNHSKKIIKAIPLN